MRVLQMLEATRNASRVVDRIEYAIFCDYIELSMQSQCNKLALQ
jgi:hypothetical protein